MTFTPEENARVQKIAEDTISGPAVKMLEIKNFAADFAARVLVDSRRPSARETLEKNRRVLE